MHLVGQYDYSGMYEADPNTSAIIFLLSVVFFTYFVMNMYTAIVVRTYNKLRESKFFLAEAMARILLKDLKDYLDKWYRFFICRRTPKPTRSDNSVKANDNNSSDITPNDQL